MPVLPQGNEPISVGIRNLPVSQLQDVAQVRKTFDAAYPIWYDGDATAVRAGSTVTVLSNHQNTDAVQTYSVPLDGEFIKRLSGSIGPHAYLVGKLEEQGRWLWLQSNSEYPERDTELSVFCIRKPLCKIEPKEAVKTCVWDEKACALKMCFSHQAGAVEVTLE